MANRIQDTAGDRMFYRVNAILLMLLTLSVLYPIIYVLANSFSSPAAVSSGKVYLWPLDPSVEGYRRVLENPNILSGFLNSVFYTVVGTAINLAMTMIAAYPMARKDLPLRSFFSVLFAFTMLFGGGMIPNYILIMKLGMLNTRWALLLPGALSVYNMIIARTAMQSLPDELLEAAYIDGCSDARYFVRIVLPLSGATIAVLALYYAVGHWNSYFSAFMYLSDRSKYPLQIVLREILIMGQIAESDITDLDSAERIQGLSQLLKYALIVISSAPMMLIYPFVQKYFVKGVMIGSLKG
ncbi:MAG TPA: carbohydrate ABC transporter permease [Candidatus Ornithocaccomicrobium faecavium]|uniref:Carbohydrate ABC transporter permease n=1 Tax=Candidatus Ornithocaccomicrobium faecavium TaxID=2840890 RepID=A0A9D1TDM8_9FIRM|nr:carbohydrate ABC transporter permease [Clostridiales bacterium]HIV28363.1 carbohydrate ABC transporter permease [Candidatus Ornithocaccomicrobium faecavium]